MFSRVVEEFLFRNVVNHKKFVSEINKRLTPYKHIIREFKDEWVNLLTMQYFIHAIFKKDGLIKNYLNHSAVKRLSQNEKDFLHYLYYNPWKFSFSVITGQPAENFFEMEDVFTNETFLLYSPGITDIIKKENILLWFNLIGFNGECWQSYGPIAAYQSFQPEDIFFFANEVKPNKWIENGRDLMADVEENPVPYFMLLSGAAYPLTYNKNDQIVQVTAEYDIDSFDTKGLETDFKIEYTSNVYKLALKRWAGHPHFSEAYYDEKEKILILFSMTDRGFTELVNRLNNHGYDLYLEPDIRVNIAMTVTAAKILNKEITLNKYSSLFNKEQANKNDDSLKKINNLLSLAIPDINAGRKPNIEALARKTGVDIESARDIIEHISERLDVLHKSSKKK